MAAHNVLLLPRALDSSRPHPGYALHAALRRILAYRLSVHVDHYKLDGRAPELGREPAVGRLNVLRKVEEIDPGEIPSLSSTAQSREEGGINVKSRSTESTGKMRRVWEPGEETNELLQHDLPLHQISAMQMERNV